MNAPQRLLRRIDDLQQAHRPAAFAFATVKKFGDDQAGNLAALVAYFGFFSLFPLLMVAVTVLGMLTQGNAALRTRVLNSALRNFPVIGTQLGQSVKALNGGGLALVIALLLTLWSGLAVIKVFENAMDTVWDVPFKERANFFKKTARALVMLAVLGVLTSISSLSAGIGAGSHSVWMVIAGALLALGVNVVLFLCAFRILTSADVSWQAVAPGAVAGAVAWTLLQAVGGFYIAHQLKGASEVYGTFAIVIGLLAWIYLGAQITLYAAEVNVVRRDHLWPRSVHQPPLTPADRRAFARYAKQEERLDTEEVNVRIDGP
ncbi:MAG: YihY/virulence factor BrkB family protein [Actinomycetota bacterium]